MVALISEADLYYEYYLNHKGIDHSMYPFMLSNDIIRLVIYQYLKGEL